MILIFSDSILIFEAAILIFLAMILIFDLDQKICDLLQLWSCLEKQTFIFLSVCSIYKDG